MGRVRHADCATGTLGGAPYEATKRLRGVPKWAGGRMRTMPLGLSVEPPMRPRSSWGCRNCLGHACERGHWDLRWSSLWGYDPREGCAEMVC